MLKMTDPGLSDATISYLNEQQNAIDSILGFSSQKREMETRWANRTDGEGAEAFDEVKRQLKEMAIAKKYCNYCEHNHFMKTTIEHIRPKSIFPAHAFRWDNFLYACENCNMGRKKGKMYVFSPVGSTHSTKTGQSKPQTDDIAFIQPRSESGLDFMELSFVDFQFYPTHKKGSREFSKFDNTLKILELDDDDLAHSRWNAFESFKNCLSVYCAAMVATNHNQLRAVVQGYPAVDNEKPFVDEQQNVLNSIKGSIFRQQHLTVWREMQRRVHELSSELQQLFQKSGAEAW
jgi:uncharacterized protein (TIGR02646 family)